MTARSKKTAPSRKTPVVDSLFAPVVAFFAKNRAGRSKEDVQLFDPAHGRLMQEWIAVETWKANWVALASEAYNFVKH